METKNLECVLQYGAYSIQLSLRSALEVVIETMDGTCNILITVCRDVHYTAGLDAGQENAHEVTMKPQDIILTTGGRYIAEVV